MKFLRMHLLRSPLPAFLISLLAAGCVSTYHMKYEEVDAEGGYITFSIEESVPPGGKKLSEGSAQASVDADGGWGLLINGEAQTDAAGTAEFYRAIVSSAVQAAIAAAAAAAVPPSIEALP